MTTDALYIDGNEAAALVAHRLSEVVAIYPITPASPMGELADAWSAAARTNLWGAVPEVVEMQSEAGAAGVLHGAASRGALATTFTASQGLLLMLPNLYKLAGELTPAVIHVAARAIATHALSIFGDHSDAMAARSTGVAMLASSSPQEAHDLALIAHAATLETRVPFLHFFDGFRTSHEVNRVAPLADDDLRALVREARVLEHRARRLDPDHPVLRGSAQNPDVFFQAREACNPYYLATPAAVQSLMDTLAARVGRRYGLVQYEGHPEAERVVVLMGSAAGAASEAVDALCAAGERVGVLRVLLYRPFPAEALITALPRTVRAIAVMDRCKEPGAPGEPLYQDVVCALFERWEGAMPAVRGVRYGLSSKEFTPAMAKGVLDALASGRDTPRHATIGIVDDVTRASLPYDRAFSTDRAELRARLYGVGSDGTVSAAKNAVKIAGDRAGRYAQGYFVYDSRKQGQMTVSHLRFAREPVRATYQVLRANFVACHQFELLERVDVLGDIEPGATLLLNTAHAPGELFAHLPAEMQRAIVERGVAVWAVDADRIAREEGLGGRINTVMQTCFLVLAGLVTREAAVDEVKRAAARSYARAGDDAAARNDRAVERALGLLARVEVPVDGAVTGAPRRAPVPREAPDFVQRVTARILAGEGDLLPVSALPPDGTFPTATSRWEKRGLAEQIPAWDPSLCIDCGKCAVVCPHAAIRMKAFDPGALAASTAPPAGFLDKPYRGRELAGARLAIYVSPDDCTGCGLCVEACPPASRAEPAHRSLAMSPAAPQREAARAAFAFTDALPSADITAVAEDTVKGSQLRPVRFEFPSACAGCGETPYLKLLSQLFGDRMIVANATGCSSIFGGNLPTTPWSVGPDGRGPAWANSLFEDNAEFGLGIRLALERQDAEARALLGALAPRVGEDLARALLASEQRDAREIAAQRARVDALAQRLAAMGDDPVALRLASVAGDLVRKSVWVVGGDGWAYDIGFGGLDHVLASGRKVNVLVLDTEVYSNTGGQASKATPRGAVARFAAGGKPTAKKDLGRMAMTYGNVYVAQVAIGADDRHTVRALLEADAWPGPSLVIAYCPCIAHGIELCHSLEHQREAVRSRYWPLYHYAPGAHDRPMHLDVRQAALPLAQFESSEPRFALAGRTPGDPHVHLLTLAEGDVARRWQDYSELAGIVPSEHPAGTR